MEKLLGLPEYSQLKLDFNEDRFPIQKDIGCQLCEKRKEDNKKETPTVYEPLEDLHDTPIIDKRAKQGGKRRLEFDQSRLQEKTLSERR